MLVKDLIEKLSKIPQDAHVLTSRGYYSEPLEDKHIKIDYSYKNLHYSSVEDKDKYGNRHARNYIYNIKSAIEFSVELKDNVDSTACGEYIPKEIRNIIYNKLDIDYRIFTTQKFPDKYNSLITMVNSKITEVEYDEDLSIIGKTKRINDLNKLKAFFDEFMKFLVSDEYKIKFEEATKAYKPVAVISCNKDEF